MKNIAFTLSVFLLFSSCFGIYIPHVAANTVENNITILKDTKELTILKIENNEILEQHNVEGKEYFISRSEDGDFKIERHGNKVHLTDLETNQIVRIIEPEIVSDTGIDDSEIVSPYMEEVIGGGSAYKHMRTRKMSMDTVGLSASIVAGTIASYAFKSKAKGTLVGAVAAVLASKLPKIYWKEARYERTQSIWKYKKWIITVYKYHDFTHSTGTDTTIQKFRIGR